MENTYELICRVRTPSERHLKLPGTLAVYSFTATTMTTAKRRANEKIHQLRAMDYSVTDIHVTKVIVGYVNRKN